MARFPVASLSDAVKRWAGRDRYGLPGVQAETTHDDLGLHGAEVTINTKAGEVKLLVTSVAAAAGIESTRAVDEAFRVVTSAPSDAVVLADEVERLRAKVKRLEEGPGPLETYERFAAYVLWDDCGLAVWDVEEFQQVKRDAQARVDANDFS